MIEVPRRLAENLPKYYGDRGRRWLAAPPRILDAYLDRWSSVPDGTPMHGVVGPAVPVQRLIADTIVYRPRRTPSGPVRP